MSILAHPCCQEVWQDVARIGPPKMTIDIPESVATVLNQADCSGAVSEEFISEIERQSGMAFPGEYRAYLSSYGAALLPGFELHGLVPSAIEGAPPYWTDIVKRHQQLAPGRHEEVTPVFIPVR